MDVLDKNSAHVHSFTKLLAVQSHNRYETRTLFQFLSDVPKKSLNNGRNLGLTVV